ncbi:uncharacterized protein C16orf59 homolog isoform X2 [Octodon degus]|uniref:Uncharacterized protein C16orf59 homolog isoform X2 n=1 Tax=Octodon degus TaxID=10160 RepID=A0A6P6E4X7_OCTDE|nr:uncharacterized protein C16orf59 homolog isoform X2 [Octodon degus]
MAVLLQADCARRLMAELRGALDACAERQRQLEQSLRVSRRLLQAWEPVGTTALEPPPGSKTKKDPSPVSTPSPQDLKELELLTQALEKAIRVRKGISKTAERGRTPSLKSGSIALSPGTTASAVPQSSNRVGHCSSRTRPTKGIHQTKVPAKSHPELPLVRNRPPVGIGAQATRLESNHREQMTLSGYPHAAETFTLKEKGILLRLPMAFRKAAFQNSCLWTHLNSTQTNDATNAAKNQFLQKMQMSSSISSSRFSAVDVEMEAQCLQKACALLRLRMQEELSAALTEQLTGPCLMRRPLKTSFPCGGRVCTSWGPQLLLYSSTQELQTLATLRLRVAMLKERIHLEKVLMAELLPMVSTQELQGEPWLALCRATHSLLCEGGERFLTILHEDPAD